MSHVCRYCGQAIDWAVRADGRKVPVNGDGGNHFATCHGWKRKMARQQERLKAKREAEEARRQMRLF